MCMSCNKIDQEEGKVIHVQSMRVYGGGEVERHAFVNLAVDKGKWVF